MRIGIGYDIHKLKRGRPLILGGVAIPFSKGLLGHSDADVLAHAIADAILGGMGLGDLGRHFPNNDLKYKGICSLKILEKINQLLLENNFKIVNIDSMILAQAPKIDKYRDRMKKNLSSILKVNPKLINIKATTAEKLGAIGRGQGIASYAVVLLEEKN